MGMLVGPEIWPLMEKTKRNALSVHIFQDDISGSDPPFENADLDPSCRNNVFPNQFVPKRVR